jgi:NADH dehydrogenase/NADH:ubiquinone oxidoreductase subunit G
MSEILLEIDGKKVAAREGMTVLEAAKSADIKIPTLCHHELLEPYGGCRLCTVEADVRGRTNYVVSCLYPVAKDLVVRTRSAKIDRIRRRIIELSMAHAPDSVELLELAREYGADAEFFEKETSFCILCGLCVRYCNEIKKKGAIAFVDRGTLREIRFIPEIASVECWNCKECFPLCPTSALQAAYVFTEALTSPKPFFEGKV